MMMVRETRPLLLAALLGLWSAQGLAQTLAPAPAPASAQAGAPAEPPISVELNKLEPQTGAAPGCRAYIVAQNPGPVPLEQLRLDLVMFGTDGVIARRIALDLGPLQTRKIAVRLFDLPGMGCDAIGRVLVNDVLVCRTGGATPADQDHNACLDRLAVSSRGSVPLVK